jgi:hypothetical protein
MPSWIQENIITPAKNAANSAVDAALTPVKNSINGAAQTAFKYGSYGFLAAGLAGLGLGYVADSWVIKAASMLFAVPAAIGTAICVFAPEKLEQVKIVAAPVKEKSIHAPQIAKELAVTKPSNTPLLDALLQETPLATKAGAPMRNNILEHA